MSEFIIEQHIEAPIPKFGRPFKYPWDQMNVGDSFFVAGVTSTYMSVACRHRRLKGERYTTRTENGGCRIWRVL